LSSSISSVEKARVNTAGSLNAVESNLTNDDSALFDDSSSTNSFSSLINQNLTNIYYNTFLSDGIRNVPIGRELSIINNSSIYNSGLNNVTTGTNNSTDSSDDILNSIAGNDNVSSSNNNNSSNVESNISSSDSTPVFRVEIKAKSESIKNQISDGVLKASEKYGVDPNLILAVIQTESSFNPDVVSSAGAVGLMQIMPANFKHLGLTDPYNIEQNIDAGTKLLKEYLDKYNGNEEMALMAYNGGPTRMTQRGVTSPSDIYKMPKETQNYVPKVMNIYRQGL
jgi:soluble lytic murein transglycosylase-like protein